jgi:hypothetical protein
MAPIRIHSRLQHFSLLTRITRVSSEAIGATADFHRLPAFCGLEVMAQLAALHVRHCTFFQRHAFLLKVHRYRWRPQKALSGCYTLSAEQDSKSSDAFVYRVWALGPEDARLDADLLIGTQAYTDEFREDILQAHYRNVFYRLQHD